MGVVVLVVVVVVAVVAVVVIVTVVVEQKSSSGTAVHNDISQRQNVLDRVRNCAEGTCPLLSGAGLPPAGKQHRRKTILPCALRR